MDVIDRPSCWVWKDRLNRAVAFPSVFRKEVQAAMDEDVWIPHITGPSVRICNETDIYVDAVLMNAFKNGIASFGQDVNVFGVFEEWGKSASIFPQRQVVLLCVGGADVLSYEDRTFFYIAPSFDHFWTSALIFTHQTLVAVDGTDGFGGIRNRKYFTSLFEELRLYGVMVQDSLPMKPNFVSCGDAKVMCTEKSITYNGIDHTISSFDVVHNQSSSYLKRCLSKGTQTFYSYWRDKKRKLRMLNRCRVTFRGCTLSPIVEENESAEDDQPKPETAPEMKHKVISSVYGDAMRAIGDGINRAVNMDHEEDDEFNLILQEVLKLQDDLKFNELFCSGGLTGSETE